MATAAQKLTYDEFAGLYGNKTHEYWYGEAIPKSVPTIIHGLLQKILMQLLDEAGFVAASEVELRVDLDARPRPDVIAFAQLPNGPYPTQAPDIVIEVISEDDKVASIRERCRKYEDWGCRAIFLVDPSDRSLVRWENGSQLAIDDFAGIKASRIWRELDKQFASRRA